MPQYRTHTAWATLFGFTALVINGGSSEAGVLPQPSAGPGQALVYLYRAPKMLNSGRAASFFIDDIKVVDLGSGGCSLAAIPAGPHTLTQKWKAVPIVDFGSQFIRDAKTLTIDGEWLPGNTYYYELDVSGGFAGYRTIEVNWRLAAGDAKAGMLRMAGCRYMPAETFGKLAAEIPRLIRFDTLQTTPLHRAPIQPPEARASAVRGRLSDAVDRT